MRNRPFWKSETVNSPCRYTRTEIELRRILSEGIFFPIFESSIVRSLRGRTFAVCSPHKKVTSLSDPDLSTLLFPHPSQSCRLASLVSRNSGPAISTVTSLSLHPFGLPKRNRRTTPVPRAPVRPVIDGLTPRVSQLSANLSATRGMMNSRHGVLGGLSRALLA